MQQNDCNAYGEDTLLSFVAFKLFLFNRQRQNIVDTPLCYYICIATIGWKVLISVLWACVLHKFAAKRPVGVRLEVPT
jgi:hypothetical protein